MEWIVEGLTRTRLQKVYKDAKGAPDIRERLSTAKQEARLFLGGLGRLVGGVDLLCEAGAVSYTHLRLGK